MTKWLCPWMERVRIPWIALRTFGRSYMFLFKQGSVQLVVFESFVSKANTGTAWETCARMNWFGVRQISWTWFHFRASVDFPWEANAEPSITMYLCCLSEVWTSFNSKAGSQVCIAVQFNVSQVESFCQVMCGLLYKITIKTLTTHWNKESC